MRLRLLVVNEYNQYRTLNAIPARHEKVHSNHNTITTPQ